MQLPLLYQVAVHRSTAGDKDTDNYSIVYLALMSLLFFFK